MSQYTKLFMRKVFFICALTTMLPTPSCAQGELHFDVDYHYNLGISECSMGGSYKRDEYKMGGHSLRFATRYAFSPSWSAGIGIGLDRYTQPDYNTLPVYATARYAPICTIPNSYIFVDLGYAIKTGDFVPGLTGTWGVGYTMKIANQLTANFQIGYNLKKFEEIPVQIHNPVNEAFCIGKETCTRHSISFGVGLTF